MAGKIIKTPHDRSRRFFATDGTDGTDGGNAKCRMQNDEFLSVKPVVQFLRLRLFWNFELWLNCLRGFDVFDQIRNSTD